MLGVLCVLCVLNVLCALCVLCVLRVLCVLCAVWTVYVACTGRDAALVVYLPRVPFSLADCASKAAMGGLLHALVCDLSQHNIQV